MQSKNSTEKKIAVENHSKSLITSEASYVYH